MTQDIITPYGAGAQTAQIADSWAVDWIEPRDAKPVPDPKAEAIQALDAPVGMRSLTDFKDVSSVTIAINDKTRPVPHAELLPPLLDRLAAMGIARDQITLAIATGTHPVMPPSEYESVLPRGIIERYPIVCHDATDVSAHDFVGTTQRGTPVAINRAFIKADLRIVVGNIEPHQFMGFSGGVKSAAIGLAAKSTISHNHAFMSHDNARLGQYVDNPAREDVEEIGRMIRVDFALNAILNGHKRIVKVFAGDPVEVMNRAIPIVREIFERPVDNLYDVVVAAPGGKPKDINVYQAQKSLAHAARITKPGGDLILVAACPDGTGSASYERWVTQNGIHEHQHVLERFAAEGFAVGPHKAFQISRDAIHFRTRLISELDDQFARTLLFEPAASLQSALDDALLNAGPQTRIAIMPQANATIPFISGE